MSETKPPTITLAGKTYALSWGDLARIRYASLPQEVRDLQPPASDIQMLWASMVGKPNPFLTWEHVAELITKDNIGEVRALIEVLFPIPTDEKKRLSESEPLTDSASD